MLITYKDYFELARKIQIAKFIYSFSKSRDVSLCLLRAAEGTSTMTFSSKKKSGVFVEARQKATGDVNSVSQIRENI